MSEYYLKKEISFQIAENTNINKKKKTQIMSEQKSNNDGQTGSEDSTSPSTTSLDDISRDLDLLDSLHAEVASRLPGVRADVRELQGTQARANQARNTLDAYVLRARYMSTTLYWR